jgi:AraC-like DNA-binding protein
MQVAGIGRVLFWEGGSLWLALVTGVMDMHAHHAIQVSLPVDGTVRFKTGRDWASYAGALIPPDVPHAFEAPGTIVANILFEPESAAGRAMLGRYGTHEITALPAADCARLVAPLGAAYSSGASDAELVSLARGVVAAMSGIDPQAPATDGRIVAAIDYIRSHIEEPIALAALARLAGLSPSRFRHLFVRETGVTCKAFVLWERLNKALALGFGGMSWTEAAHAANFADSAHLSRTCRRMFGLAPSSARIEQPDAVRRLSA